MWLIYEAVASFEADFYSSSTTMQSETHCLLFVNHTLYINVLWPLGLYNAQSLYVRVIHHTRFLRCMSRDFVISSSKYNFHVYISLSFGSFIMSIFHWLTWSVLNFMYNALILEREGTCNVPAACRGNAVLLGSCKNDGDCPTKEHKCCVGLLDGSCLKHCVLPEAGKTVLLYISFFVLFSVETFSENLSCKFIALPIDSVVALAFSARGHGFDPAAGKEKF